MQYRTLADLSNLVRTNIYKVPHDIDLVVGIPRSGMLPANMIALFLNKKMSDIDSFCEGRIMSTGKRSQYIADTGIKRVLIVDDSVNQGNSIKAAKDKLTVLNDKFEFVYLAPIVSSCGKELVDIYFEIIDDRRIFEWNLFHHPIIGRSCLDIDGILNKDPEIDDDGNIYKQFLHDATPMFLPTVEIETLITCRLEKYRNDTESWLKRHNIRYKNLVMLDLPSREERIKWGRYGEFKGEYYKNNNQVLFIESNKKQAQIIANISNKPVICLECNSLISPETSVKLKENSKSLIKKMINLILHGKIFLSLLLIIGK